MENQTLIYIFLLLLFQVQLVLSTYVKNVTAFKTCGSPPEQYLRSWQASIPARNRIPYLCNASDPRFSFPPENMFDNDESTFWQTTGGEDAAVIIVDIRSPSQKFLFVDHVVIKFGDSQRPGQIKLSKRVNGEETYLPWHYLVSKAEECSNVFKVPYAQTPKKVDDVLCALYEEILPQSTNETVVIDMMGGRETMNGLKSWLKATHLKIEFSGLFPRFDILSTRWHHYNVREIKIKTSCYCNGHASTCVDASNNGTYICKCENNACGTNCDTCCPKFNQKPWISGGLNPFFVDSKIACQECNCFNHSDTCYYNDTVARNKKSLNMSNIYDGGGVCLNCLHNTTGINCERCDTYFYHTPSYNFTHPKSCQPCNCSIVGTANVSSFPYLDCVKNNSIVGKNIGDCLCKENVEGRQCNSCKDGFFNLTMQNPLGCNKCNCFTQGTINTSTTCSSDGQCHCKQNVIGYKCNKCKDGYFNLTNNNNDGCSGCFCDLGGSLTNICHNMTGLCSCRSVNIIGSKCTDLKDGFYFPFIYFISDENLKSMNSLFVVWQGILNIPSYSESSENDFKLIFKCSSNVKAVGFVTVKYTSFPVAELQFESNCVDCLVMTDIPYDLAVGRWEVDISFLTVTSSDDLSCTKLIGIPKEFYSLNAVRNTDSFSKHCSLVSGMMNNSVCEQAAFSMTMDYLHQPLNCSCDETGALNDNCEKYGGQCQCKEGVEGRQCNKCAYGFFNLTNTGCQRCNCYSTDQICNSFTGQCNCHPSTVGRTCNECASGYWNLTKDFGCQPCKCDVIGAENNICNSSTGQCNCKPNVDGLSCSECADGYTDISTVGCIPCNCSVDGSVSQVCNKTNGQCLCKQSTKGKYCNVCASGSFYLTPHTKNGCLDCFCMGVTKNCSAISGNYHVKSPFVTWRINNLFDNSSSIAIYNTTNAVNGTSKVLLSAAIPARSKNLYWIATMILGVSSYGGSLQFLVLSIYNGVNSHSYFGQQKIILKGYNNMLIFHEFNATKNDYAETISVSLKEKDWNEFESNNKISRERFLLMLAKPLEVFMSISQYHQAPSGYFARMGDFKYYVYKSNDSANNVSPVEKCMCPSEYAGFSCETCTAGYFHSYDNTSVHPFGNCISCNCNNHSKNCHVDTGHCYNCQNNTGGKHCEICTPGFYSQSRNPDEIHCVRCPCYSPQSESQECEVKNNGSVSCLNCSVGFTGPLCEQCDEGFFMSKNICIPCQCNNHSSKCHNVTGECYDCENNTSGKRCEECVDGWFRDSTSIHCKECKCNATGSLNKSCDNDGQCHCRKNVVGKTCASCKEYTYGLNNISGCIECSCDLFGSTSFQCDNQGHCSCKTNITGSKCDKCVTGLWGSTNTSCKECLCNTTGSVNTYCDNFQGQCFCKPGVTNRNCDSCMKQHRNFTEKGCDSCPECSKLLQKYIDQHWKSFNDLVNKGNIFNEARYINENLDNASATMTSTMLNEKNFTKRITFLKDFVGSIESLSQLATSRVTGVEDEIKEVNKFKDEVFMEQVRLNNTKDNLTSTFEQLLDLNVTSSSLCEQFDDLISNSSYQLVNVNSINTSNIIIANQTFLNVSRRIINESLVAEDLFKTLLSLESNTSQQALEISKQISTYRNMILVYNSLTSQYKDLVFLYDGLMNKSNNIVAENTLLKMTNTNISRSINETEAQSKNISLESIGTHSVINNTKTIVNKLNTTLVNATIALQTFWLQVSTGHYILNQSFILKVLLKAQNIENEFVRIKRFFDEVKENSSKVFEIIEMQESCTVIINDLRNLSRILNETLPQVINLLPFNSEENVTALARQMARDTQLLKEVSDVQEDLALNISTNFSNYLLQYKEISLLWENITGTYQNYTKAFGNVSLYHLLSFGDLKSELRSSVSSLTEISANISSQLKSMEKQNYTVIDELQLNFTEARDRLHDQLKNLSIKDTNIQTKLNNSSVTITNAINSSYTSIRNFTDTSLSIDEKLRNLKLKIQQVKESFSKHNPTLSFDKNTSFEIDVTKEDLFTRPTYQLEVHLKTEKQNSNLFHFQDTFSTQRQMIIRIEKGLLCVDYHFDGRNYSIKNYEIPVADGEWKSILFSRYFNSSRLTITNLATRYHRTYGNFELKHLPSSTTLRESQVTMVIGDTDLENSFVGCLSNVKLNGKRIDFLSLSMNSSLNYNVCNATYSSVQNEEKVNGTSFGGTGFILHRMGNFSLLKDFKIKVKFRTFKKSSLLLMFEGDKKNEILSISLVSQQIVVTITSPAQSFIKSATKHLSNGEWFVFDLKYTNGNISMQLRKDTSVLESTSLILPAIVNDSRLIWIGGANKSSIESFVGCMEYLVLSNDGSKNVPRNLNGDLLQHAVGVSFHGCYKQVIEGYHFYEEGYSIIQLPRNEELISIDIIFKTDHPNGLIFTYKHNETLLSISLFHGNLFIIINNDTLVSTSQTLNDGGKHRVQLTFKNELISLDLDGGRVQQSLRSKRKVYLAGNSSVYVGMYEQSSEKKRLPVQFNFVGDILELNINRKSLMADILKRSYRVSGDNVHVSALNVTPTNAPTYPPTTAPPPTCSIDAPDLQFMNNSQWIGFDRDSRLVIQPRNEDKFLSIFRRNFLITIEFRAFSTNGLILFMTGHHGNHFISLELMNGALKYQFRTGQKIMTVTSRLSSYGDGQWHTVFLIRLARLGIIMIKNDFMKEDIGSFSLLNITLPIYMGKIPNHLNTSMLQKTSLNSFHGCVRTLNVSENDNQVYNLNLSEYALNKSSEGLRPCYLSVYPQVSFRANGYYISPKNISTSRLSLSMRLRTSRLNGVLLWIGTKENALCLHLVDGKVLLTQLSDGKQHNLIAWLGEQKLWKNKSYKLCDGNSHSIKLERVNQTYLLLVDKKQVAITTVKAEDLIGPLFIGGGPIGKIGFYGCMEQVLVSERHVDFSRGKSVAMHHGCAGD